MLVPNFEIKDSYIIKNKLNYDSRFDGEYSGLTYGIMFTDYDLARKTQNKNAENFDDMIISGDTSYYTSIKMSYYDLEYIIQIDDYVEFQSGVTSLTMLNSNTGQSFFVDNTSLYKENDYLEVSLFRIVTTSSASTWSHYGAIGETWYVSGTTLNNNQWEFTGLTTSSGQSYGSISWTIDENIPILKYNTFVTSTGGTYINVLKKIEDYYFNNLQSPILYPNLYYKIVNLKHCPNSYGDFSNYFKKSIFGNNLDCNIIDDQLIISPLHNPFDIYFNYDTFEIMFSGTI